MTTVIIPAYNEGQVIAATLQSLFVSIGARDVDVIVSCNACRDDTAEIARGFDPRVQVVESDEPGKCQAINRAEKLATSFPCIYLDADIRVSPSFIEDLEHALDSRQVRAAWPHAEYDLSGCSMGVKAYYRVWTALPYNRPGRIGVGVYALNQAARQRFAEFPAIVSDDGFVRGMYRPEERVIVASCHTVVRPPQDLKSLVAVRTRSRLGVFELRREHPQVLAGHYDHPPRSIAAYLPLLTPARLLSLPVYAAVVLLSKYRAKQRMQRSGSQHWDRDESARASAQ